VAGLGRLKPSTTSVSYGWHELKSPAVYFLKKLLKILEVNN
jgi:hypothetical protein